MLRKQKNNIKKQLDIGIKCKKKRKNIYELLAVYTCISFL